MNDRDFAQLVDRLVRRLRLVRTLRALVHSALAAAVLLAAALVVDKFVPLGTRAWTVVLVVVALGVLGASAAGFLARVSRLRAASLADRRFDLEDRLANAVAFLDCERPTEFMRAHLRETAVHLGTVRPELAVPFRSPGGLPALAAAALVLGLLVILPSFATSGSPTTEPAEPTLPPLRFAAEDTVRTMLEHTDAAGDARLAEVLRDLERLYARIRAGELGRDEALRRFGEVEAKLDDVEHARTEGRPARTWRRELEKALGETGKTLRKSPASAGLGRALENLKLDEAARETRSLAGEVAGKTPTLKLTPEQSQALAKVLERAAGKSRRTLESLSKHMNDAARELTREDLEAMAKSLEQMARDIEKLDQEREELADLARIDDELEEAKSTVSALRRADDGTWTFSVTKGDRAGGFFELAGDFPEEKGEPASGAGDEAVGDGTGGEPERIDATKKPVLLPGKWGDGPGLVEIVRGAAAEGVATAEYRDVAEAARRLAEAAVHSEDIPLGYRLYIKRYFQLIRPRSDETRETP
jgi:hypothetical protein